VAEGSVSSGFLLVERLEGGGGELSSTWSEDNPADPWSSKRPISFLLLLTTFPTSNKTREELENYPIIKDWCSLMNARHLKGILGSLRH